MEGPFGGLAIPASGMSTFRTWIDVLADNVANVSTVRSTSEAAFQERFLMAREKSDGTPSGGGVEVTGIDYGDPLGRQVYDPNHPLADAEGMVRMPDMNLSDLMASLILAQRGYQLNVAVFERQRDAYQRALEIGRQ